MLGDIGLLPDMDQPSFDVSVIRWLSTNLTQEVRRHNCQETLSRVPFFAHADPNFTDDIVAHLKPEFYQPGDYIIRKGITGTKVFFIRSGVVSAVTDDNVKVGFQGPGTHFGGTRPDNFTFDCFNAAMYSCRQTYPSNCHPVYH